MDNQDEGEVCDWTEVVLSCWKLEGQRVLIGLLLSALSPFKMILFWGLKKTPLLLENPALKDHLKKSAQRKWECCVVWCVSVGAFWRDGAIVRCFRTLATFRHVGGISGYAWELSWSIVIRLSVSLFTCFWLDMFQFWAALFVNSSQCACVWRIVSCTSRSFLWFPLDLTMRSKTHKLQ